MHARSSDSNILHNSILHSCIVSNNLDYNDSQQEHMEDVETVVSDQVADDWVDTPMEGVFPLLLLLVL